MEELHTTILKREMFKLSVRPQSYCFYRQFRCRLGDCAWILKIYQDTECCCRRFVPLILTSIVSWERQEKKIQTAQFCQVVPGARVHRAVVLHTAQTDGEEMTGTGGWRFSAMKTGVNVGSGVQISYRRSDHLICSLADWRTWRFGQGLTHWINITQV